MVTIDQLLPDDVYEAAVNANSPSASNPFATMADIMVSASGLPAVLAIDNTTGPNDISVDNGQVIKGTSSGSFIDLDDGANGAIQINSKQSVYFQGGEFGVTTRVGLGVFNDIGSGMSLSNTTGSQIGDVFIVGNDTVDVIQFDVPNYPVTVGSRKSTMKQGVVNTVAAGGKNIIAKTNNALYTNQLILNGGAPFETVLNHITPTADRLIYLQDGNGTLAFLSDITGTNSGTNTGDQDSGTTFIVSNDNTLRTINANNINGANLRDLICTLIRDLNTAGVLTV